MSEVREGMERERVEAAVEKTMADMESRPGGRCTPTEDEVLASGKLRVSNEVALEAENERLREALEAFVQGYEWAFNDAIFAAPEDMDHRRRQWQVLGDRAERARAALSLSASQGEQET